MNRSTFVIFGVLILFIAVTVVVYMVESHHHVVGPVRFAIARSATGQVMFTDNEHGIIIRYPEVDQVDYTFTSFTHLPPNWRMNALANATGTPILAIIGYRTEHTNSYPRYFDTEVRIGASNDPKEIAACETVATSSGETALPDIILGGTTFKAFAFQSGAAMEYVKGVSYRTLHDGSCVAIEKFEVGSAYRDPPSSADIPQNTLDAAYAALDPIVASFMFNRP